MYESFSESLLIEKLRSFQLKSLVDWQSEADLFVPLLASVSAFSKEDFNLDDDIERFLKSDKKVLLLLGDAGSGKSLCTQGLIFRKWKSYKLDDPIPLWISLPCLKNPVEHAIEETLQKTGCSASEIETLRQENQFLFVFDGVDEIGQHNNLTVTNRFENWRAQAIFTCRREYLYHRDNYALQFTPFIKERAIHTAYLERVIKPFSAEQIDKYLQQQVSQGCTAWSDWQRYRAGIDEIPGLSQLLSSPFMLKLAISVLPTIVERYQGRGDQRVQMTQVAIYDAFVEQWFERQQTKLKQSRAIQEDEDKKPAFWSYAKALAQAMHEAKLTVVNFEPQESMFDEEELNPWTRFFSPEDKQVALLQTACLVREISPKNFAFVHASLLRYFLSRHLYEEILIKGLTEDKTSVIESDESTVAPEKFSDETSYFNRCLIVHDNETIQFSADKICEGEEGQALKRRYFSLIEVSKNNPAMSVAASNSMTILVRARVSLAGMDLRHVNTPEAEVEGGIFHHTDLRGANLRNVNIRKAYLANAKLQDADVTGIKFGQLPSLGFNSAIQSLAYSPDGEMLAVALTPPAIKIFYTHDFNLAAGCNIQGDSISSISSIVFTSNSQKIISGHADGKLRVWNTKSANLIRTLEGHAEEITSLAYHIDSERLLSSSADNTLRQWDCNTWECLAVSKGHTEKVTAAVFHPNGNRFVSASTDKTLKLWSTDTGGLLATCELNQKSINGLAFNSRDGQLASCGLDERGEGIIKQWLVSTESFTLLREIPRGNEAYCLAYSPDGIHLLVGSFGFLEQFSVETGTLMYTYQGQLERKPTSLAYNIDGSVICAGSNIGTRVYQWPVINTVEADLAAHQIPIHRVRFNPMGTEVASDGWDGKLRRWDANTGAMIGVLQCAKEFWNLAYSPDGQRIALCGSKGRIEVVNIKRGKRELFIQEVDQIITSICYHEIDGEQEKTIKSPGFLGEIVGIAYSSDGQRLAVGAHNRLFQFSATTGEVLMVSEGHRNVIYSVKYCQNNQVLISGSSDRTIRIWDAMTGKSLVEIEAHRYALLSIAISPNNLRIASCGSDMRVREWDISTGKLLFTLSCKEGVVAVAYHPTKNWLYAACLDGSIYVWDISQEKNPIRLARIQDFQKTTGISVNSLGDITSCGVGNAVNYWQCDITLEKPRWLLKWSTKPSQNLIIRGSHFEQAKGINNIDQLLLSQLGALGVTPKQQESMGATQLHKAVFDDDLELFEALLSQDMDPTINDKDGYSPLFLAITFGRREMVENLLQRGADLSVQESDGTYLLHRAVDNGHAEVARRLLTHGADVDAQNSDGLTSLHIAAYKGDIECIELLLDAGAKTNIPSGIGLTILHNAVKSGEPNCLKLLVLKCEDLINAKDQAGDTALHFSVAKGLIHNVTVEMLLTHGANIVVNDKKEDGSRPVIEILLAHGANPDAQNNEGLTPLHVAAFNGFHEAVDALLEGGANFRITITGGLTVLHNAAKSGDIRCLRLLLARSTEQINFKTQIGFTALHFAVDKGQCGKEIIQALLAHGANPDAQDNERLTPLHWAAFHGLHEAVEALLEGGANFRIISTIGLTVLHNAAKSGDSRCVRLLLARSTEEINFKTHDGCTPLHLAIDLGHCNIVRLLFESGADIYAQDNNGATSLHYAAFKGSREALEILMGPEVNINITNASGWTILHSVVGSGNNHCFEFLLTRCRDLINVKTLNGGWSPLHIAVNMKNKRMIEELLTQGANIDDQDLEGRTPLFWAVDGGDPEIVNVLIARGAKLTIKKNDGQSLLHCAASLNLEIVKILLSLCIEDIDAKDEDGWTPLHWASNRGHSAIVAILLSRGVNINALTNGGETSLHRAASKGLTDVIILLLENHADIEAKTKNGDTPLLLAIWNEQYDVVKLLLKHKVSLDVSNNHDTTPLQMARQKGNIKILDLLVEHGANIGEQDKNGNTLLHLSIWHEQHEVIERMLEHHASIKVPNNEGYTAILIACQRGNKTIVDLLVGHGADIHDTATNGATALHIATASGHQELARELLIYGLLEKPSNFGRRPLHLAARDGYENIVNLFLENHAVVDVPDTEFGHTPLHWAAQNGHIAIVKTLIERGADPKTRSTEGLTALALANKAGHQTVVSFLENINQKDSAEPSQPQAVTDFFMPVRRESVECEEAALETKNEKSSDSMNLNNK